MKKEYKRELTKLATGLTSRGIEFQFILLANGGQIRTRTWDAICHDFSYGHEDGLLEIMGSIVNSIDTVEGWVTARDILNRLDERSDDNG